MTGMEFLALAWLVGAVAVVLAFGFLMMWLNERTEVRRRAREATRFSAE